MTLPKDPEKLLAYRKRMSEIATGNKNCVGRVYSEETKQKMSKSAKRRCTLEWRVRQSNRVSGTKHTPDQLQKMSIALKGRKKSPETIHKMRVAARNMTEEHRKNISISKTNPPPETRRKMSEWQKGENNNSWNGGSSFEPYCPKFNNEFRERVRAFFNYCCIECGTPQNGRKLGVHHVNYNKKTCCNDEIPLFVPLCNSCHSKTTGKNREYWKLHFTEIINSYYGGKCYLTRDEIQPMLAISVGGG